MITMATAAKTASPTPQITALRQQLKEGRVPIFVCRRFKYGGALLHAAHIRFARDGLVPLGAYGDLPLRRVAHLRINEGTELFFHLRGFPLAGLKPLSDLPLRLFLVEDVLHLAARVRNLALNEIVEHAKAQFIGMIQTAIPGDRLLRKFLPHLLRYVSCLHELTQLAECVKPFKIRTFRVAALEYGVFDLVLIDRIIVLLKILNNVLRDILRAAIRTESEFPRIIH